MTESESIKELEDNIDLPFGVTISDEASRMAINALEKQIPKKPKDRYKTKYVWDSAYCPVCNCGITARWVYCQCCGQKLDWSDEE